MKNCSFAFKLLKIFNLNGLNIHCTLFTAHLTNTRLTVVKHRVFSRFKIRFIKVYMVGVAHAGCK